jgi:hypothetical protein
MRRSGLASEPIDDHWHSAAGVIDKQLVAAGVGLLHYHRQPWCPTAKQLAETEIAMAVGTPLDVLVPHNLLAKAKGRTVSAPAVLIAVYPGDIIPERWAKSSRNAKRHQIGLASNIIPDSWTASPGISTLPLAEEAGYPAEHQRFAASAIRSMGDQWLAQLA